MESFPAAEWLYFSRHASRSLRTTSVWARRLELNQFVYPPSMLAVIWSLYVTA